MSLGCADPEVDAAGTESSEVRALFDNVRLGTPRDATPQDEYLIERSQFTLSFNHFRNSANWVAWTVKPSDFGVMNRYEDQFFHEDRLPSGWFEVDHWDYVNSGYDRGHMARAEERTGSMIDHLMTFKMSNVLPQVHELNVGPWYGFEKYCQNLVVNEGFDLFMYAGGIYDDACRTDQEPEGNYPASTCKTIGKSKYAEKRVAVPKELFKIVVRVPHGGTLKDVETDTRVTAIILKNDVSAAAADWPKFITSVDEIEKRTGYDFLTRLVPEIEDSVEALVDQTD